jgi:endonuclease/exonuclease/phosphatase family metal-dependent hydrolase
MHDDYVRTLQAEQMLFWVDQIADFSKDLVFIVGDFNAKPDSKTYRYFIDRGYVSAHAHANGSEPELTFPSGLQAEFMDTDPPGTFDYIFIKGKGCTIKSAEVLGRKCSEKDSTIFGSDHLAIAADLDIEL